ncbi:MAG: hypothetical protein Fur009_2110 [Candidatus Microgenomates bacterium]
MFNMINQKIIIGTWRWQLKNKSLHLNLLNNLKLFKINKIDTALVYKDAQEILSMYDFRKIFVISKIPAIVKPLLNTKKPFFKFYNEKYIENKLDETLKSLKLKKLNLLLLHNWSYYWQEDLLKVKNLIKKLKFENRIDYFGISLPDFYNKDINFLVENDLIDFVMMPFNILNIWGIKKIIYPIINSKKNIKIILRSIFLSGLLFKKEIILYSEKNNKNNNDIYLFNKYPFELIRLKIQKFLNNNYFDINDLNKIRKLFLEKNIDILKNKNIFLCLGVNNLNQLIENLNFLNDIYENN